MFSTWWPLLLVVASSVGYQVGLKEVSDIGDPMASLTESTPRKKLSFPKD